jgi:MFS family permease
VIRGTLNVFLVVISLRLLDTGDSGVGFLTAALGVGGLVGAFTSVSLTGRRLAAPFAAGLLLWGLPLVAIAAWPEAVPALVFFAIIGGGNSILDVAGLTLLQRLLPNEVLTRALGVFWGFAMATVGIGSIVAPALIAAIGVRGALAASGALLPVLAVLTWRQLVTIDRVASVPREQLQALNGVPMFAALSVVAKEQLATALVPLSVPAGAEVIREGEHGDRFYIILEGSVDVSSRGQAVVTRTERDYFGEIALLRDVPRTATVVAKTDVRLYALERDDFLSGVTGYTGGTTAGEAVVAERLAALDTR